jgi:signal transduction histidine kinase
VTFSEVFRFNKKKEDAFQQFFYKQDLIICRAASLLVMCIMLLLIVIDTFRVADFSWVLMARMTVFSLLGTLLFLTYQKDLTPKELQVWLIAINIIFLASLFFMDAMTKMPPFYLPNSIVVFTFIVTTVSGLRYRYSSALLILLVIFSLVYFQFSSNSSFHKSQIPNIIISLHVGLLIGFIWERHKRINFLQQTQLNNILNIFSHDMVSPMNSLLSLLSLSDRNLIDKSELDEHVGNIKKTTSNNVLLLQNLVKWSKSQMDGFKPNAETVVIDLLVEDAINLLKNVADEKNIIFKNQANKNHKCIADLEMTKLILRNTLSNAIKFSHPGGAITIESTQGNGFVTLSFKDEGVGMTPEEIERLFTMQIQSTPGTANERGTGVGMYITREFVALNKGEIKVESVKGNGSTVKISLRQH